jgi:hypothetical protein
LLATPSADRPKRLSTAIDDNAAKELPAAPLQAVRVVFIGRTRRQSQHGKDHYGADQIDEGVDSI